MARFIDADVAEKMLREYADDVGCNRGEYELANGILKAVSYIRHNIPTAYDVDKVVEELTELNNFNADIIKSIPYSGNPYLHLAKEEHCKGRIQAYQNAINIVRKGGVE